ncbi:DUF4013 domain-containing protein [Chryseobacterium sp. POL2]|uniref:DUF4013 domain-containing protein n=1 Tax=Chryseobacterium sp. POL2 TaxID=2713414 RepID=UPI0013E19332|nr:DUF4013 domain-containing protein [Chryseobacterium sp. POL2]QIG89838.1 DUF4013 domain-containing protein [Chryseobacterium sp. POL2]
MQIFQERNFGNLVSDTFNFFRIYGKDYFKSYFIINGALLLIMTLLSIFFYREFFMQIFVANAGGESYLFESYFSNNWPILVLVGGIAFILLFIIAVVVYTFPIFYMKRLGENQTKISTDNLLTDMRKNVGKFFMFCLLTVIIVMPVMMIFIAISSFLMMILIGFFLFILMMPAFYNVLYLTLYDYMSTDKGYFAALSYSARSVFGNMFDSSRTRFWKYWGSTLVLGIIIYIISMAFSMIPYFMIIGNMSLNPNYDQINDPSTIFSGVMGIVFFVSYGISVLISSIVYNLMAVNAGFMYYDSRKDLHRELDINEIDTIGQVDA